MSAEQPSSLRLVLTLALAGLSSGAVLVGVYLGTLPRIEDNRAAALERAILQVLPGSHSFTVMRASGHELVPEDGAGEATDIVYAGRDAQDRLIGYAVAGEGPGFMDTIKLLYGFDPKRRVIVGMEVLESRETPGLGDKIATDPAFRKNFQALATAPEIVPVKRGDKDRANEVDCITGATISSKAVVAILNSAHARLRGSLEGSHE